MTVRLSRGDLAGRYISSHRVLRAHLMSLDPFSGKDNFPIALSTANENECSAISSCSRAAVCFCR